MSLFRALMRRYIKAGIRNGYSSLIHDLRTFISRGTVDPTHIEFCNGDHRNNFEIIQKICDEFLASLRETEAFPTEEGEDRNAKANEPPSTLVWTMFLQVSI